MNYILERIDDLSRKREVLKDDVPAVAQSSKKTLESSKFKNGSKVHIDLLKRVFEKLDLDKDGFVGIEDLQTHLRSAGVIKSQNFARDWLKEKDIDQDGRISLEEFLLHFLPKSSIKVSLDNSLKASLGLIRLFCSPTEAVRICESAMEQMSYLLQDHSTPRSFELSRTMRTFDLEFDLYCSLGFISEESSSSVLFKSSEFIPPKSVVNENMEILLDYLSFYIHTDCCDLHFGKFFWFCYFVFLMLNSASGILQTLPN
jgi:hypothetical protein